MLYLHLSGYDGAILAVVSEEAVLEDGHHTVLDAEVVESNNQAAEWFAWVSKLRPWEGNGERQANSLHLGDIRVQDDNGMWP